MSADFSRRRMMQAAGATALMPGALAAATANWPPPLGPGTPRICLGTGNATEALMRQLKQVGVDYVLGGARPFPGPRRAFASGWIASKRVESPSST